MGLFPLKISEYTLIIGEMLLLLIQSETSLPIHFEGINNKSYICDRIIIARSDGGIFEHSWTLYAKDLTSTDDRFFKRSFVYRSR